MNKTLLATTAAVLLTASVASAQGMSADASAAAEAKPGVISAISNTAGAVVEKTSQGIDSVKGSYHENMAESNAKAAKSNLAEGDMKAAATDAKDAAEHQSAAVAAKTKAANAKSKAHKDWTKAKAAVSTSATVK